MPFENLVKYFNACSRIVDTVVVLISVAMKVVVLQQQVPAGNPADIDVSVASDSHGVPKITSIKPLLHFQHCIFLAMHPAG